MRVFFILLLSIFSLQTQVWAQTDDEIYDKEEIDIKGSNLELKEKQKNEKLEAFKEHLFVGSDLDFSFWGSLYLNVGPYAGLRLGSAFALGVGGLYAFQHNFNTGAEQHIYGFRGFMRINPFMWQQAWYLHLEAEVQNVLAQNPRYNPNRPTPMPQYIRRNIPLANVGIGYSSNFYRGFGTTFEFLYNILYKRSMGVYRNPFVMKFGVYYGF